jgi:CRISPR-associated protein Cmr5
MSKKNIEKYIPEALEVLHTHYPEGVIPSAYNGYISAFGASIVQSGLTPTLALFENNNADTKEDKRILSQDILRILAPEHADDSLLRYVIYSKEDEKRLKQKILDISVALKLSIRTFRLDKGAQDG